MKNHICLSSVVLFLSSTALVSIGSALLDPVTAEAACSFTPTLGDDDFICDSGTYVGSLTDTSGNNRLVLPVGGTGTINGDVTFGPGADRLEIHSGTITGNVQQGDGIDDFHMTGGAVGSLNQGDGLDTFFMSGGHIINAFDDGDHAVMTGGRIGHVNMKLENNYFAMSGGTIDHNLVAGFGDDTIIVSSGTIGGNISVSGGADSVTITGGTIAGDILMSFGEDQFRWDGDGIVHGHIDMAGDNDNASLSNLVDTNIGSPKRLSGGEQTDSLTFNNVAAAKVDRFDSWETVNVTNNTRLTFDTSFTLGDASTGTGAFNIDASSTLLGGAAQSGIRAFTPGQLVSVVNAGRIDLTDSSSVSDTFTIAGNYTGQNGLMFIDTVLASDTAPSDKLVVDGGRASGNTSIVINNIGGTGAATASDGIMVVQALNGATTSAGAFALSGRVAAGAYEYILFKGGVSADTAENWYLRSTLANGNQPTPPAPNNTDPGGQPPLPGPNVAPPSPDATRVESDVVTLYREEVAVYSAVPLATHQLALSTLGTFHERRGEQDLLKSGGYLPASWARVFGQDADMRWKGTVTPGLDGQLYGIQAGQDIYERETESGHTDRFGLFFGYARVTGDLTGQALGWNNLDVGELDVTGTSFGGYWTHIGPEGWYVDAVLMGTWFDGNATSNRNQGIDVDGHGVTASLEGAYPIKLGESWTLEPQAQFIWQSLSLDDQADRFAAVSFDSDNAWTGRIGVRLHGAEETFMGKFRPYLKANIWQDFSSDQTVRLGMDPIVADLKGTSLEIGGGLTLDVTEKASLFATADYTTNLGGEKIRAWEGNIGLHVKW